MIRKAFKKIKKAWDTARASRLGRRSLWLAMVAFVPGGILIFFAPHVWQRCHTAAREADDARRIRAEARALVRSLERPGRQPV